MFKGLKKILTVVTVGMLVVTSLPINSLAETITDPTIETTTGSDIVENQPTETTTSSTEAESTQPSVETNQNNVSEAIGTTDNANAPNETEESKPAIETSDETKESKPTVEEPKEPVKLSMEEQLNAIGFTYKEGFLQSTTETSYRSPEDIDKALSILKEFRGSGRRTRRAVSDTIWVDRNYGDRNVHFTRRGITEWGWRAKRDSDGRILWCIEPTIPLDWDANGGFTRSEDNREVMKRASLIAYFGYEKQQSEKNAFYTEMYIGETVAGHAPTAIWDGGYSMQEYQTFKAKVSAEVETFFHLPTFAKKSVTLKAGESITLTDTTGRFRNYMIDSSGGYHVTRKGNSITIRADVNSPEKGKIKFSFNLPASYKGATLVYRHPELQDVISARINDPVWSEITVNVLKNGKGKLGKVDENGKPVANAVFEVKNVSTGKTQTLKTNAQGIFDVTFPHGTVLEIRETQAPDGFYRERETKKITIQADKTVNVSFTNIHQKGKLTLIKEDAETGDTPQGDASLDGAVYALYRANGEFVQNISFSGRKGTAENLDLGEYHVQEVQAPTGYTLDKEKHSITIAYAGQDVRVALANKTVTDKVIKGSIKGYKFGNRSLLGHLLDLFSGNGNIKNPLEGVELTVKSYTTGKTYTTTTDKYGYFEFNDLPYDKYQLSETKGKVGYRLIAPYDFEIRENDVVYQYLLEDEVIENRIKVVKVDSETGKAIARSEAQFKIYDRTLKKFLEFTVPNSEKKSEILTTNSEGYLVTSETLLYGKDRYELHEVKAPYGYVRSTKPTVFSIDSDKNETIIGMTFQNLNQKGRVAIHKTVEAPIAVETQDTEYGKVTSFDFEQQGIEGVQFKIRAVEDIVTMDNTVRVRKGQFIQKDGQDVILTTNAKGNVESPLLYLGKYELVEIKAPYGVVMLDAPVPFELTYAGQEKELTVTDKEISNDLQEVSVNRFEKEAEKITIFKNGKAVTEYVPAGKQVVYALRLKEDVPVGNTVVSKGTILAYKSANNGKVHFENIKLPRQNIGLEVVEVQTPPDLVLNEKAYSGEYVPSNNQPTHTVEIVNEKQENRLARANVALFKYDTAFHLGKETPIKDVPFELTTMLHGKKVVIGTYKTNKDGKISVESLPSGVYSFHEVNPLKGYQPYKESIDFVVNPSNDRTTIYLKAENKREPITLRTKATFENGKKELNPFKENKLKDTIEFTNLMIGKSYIWKTKIVEFGHPENVIQEFDTPFVADKIDGEYVVHTTVDGTKLRGKKIVFLETLVDGESPEHIWAEHTDSKDEGQSVRITNPKIGTKATFENELKEMNPFEESVLVDTITYKDLVPNREYRVVTKLVEADITIGSDGKALKDVSKELDKHVGVGTEVSQPKEELQSGLLSKMVDAGTQTEKEAIYESETFFTPTEKDGEYTVTIKVDGTKLRGKTVVFYEYLYDNEKPEEEQAKHENPMDEGQSVRITNPEIGTQAHGYKGETHKLIQPLKEVTLTDKINYEDVTIGREYRVVTKLIEFGNPDKAIKESETFFTPTEKDGEYTVAIKVDGLSLQGKKVTFMEYLYDKEKSEEEQAKHEEPKDEGQSVEFAKPIIKTLATGINGEKVLVGNGIQTVKEKVELTGLVVGQKYRVNVQAYIVGTKTKVDGTNAVKEFVADKPTMTFEWTFKVDASRLLNKTISFTEILETENEGGDFEEVTRHNDNHKDKDQSVTFKPSLPKTGWKESLNIVMLGLLVLFVAVMGVWGRKWMISKEK